MIPLYEIPEQWRPIPGWEGLYSVSDHGRVRSERRGALLTLTVDRLGYVRAKLCRPGQQSRHSVHRLVAEAFVGPAGDLEVNHIDGNKANNHASNLEYVTRSANMLHVVHTRGSAGWKRKLDDDKVRQIRALVASGVSQSEAGRRFGIASTNVHMIVHGKQWKHVK